MSRPPLGRATPVRGYPPLILLVALIVLTSVAQAVGYRGPFGCGVVRAAEAPFDRQFINMMVPHHQGATQMATIALARGEHHQITLLARAIVAAQDREIVQMKAWRKAWYGSDRTPSTMATLPGMTTAQMDMQMGRDTLVLKTARPFDRAFIGAMLPHHESAIAAAKLELARGTHPELKALALGIIAAQAREVGLMTAYLDLWYHSAPPGTMGGMQGM